MDQKYRYNIEQLAHELEVDIGDIAVLFLNYIHEMKEESDHMMDLLPKEEWGMLQRVAHNIKGVSSNLGIHDVYRSAAGLDEKLKRSDIEGIEVAVNELILCIKNAEMEIRRYFIEKGFSL